MSDAFVTKLNALGSALLYSTFLGGNLSDEGRGIASNGSGDVFVTGDTSSGNFPTSNPFQVNNGGGISNHDDAFVVRIGACPDTNTNSDANTNINSDTNTDSNANTITDTESDSDTGSNSRCDQNSAR